MRRGDQLGARISALRPVLGRGVSRRHATRHTDWLVCCQIARLDARCAALSPTSAKRLDLPALSLTRVRGTKRESMVDRKSVGQGKSVSVRVDIGGRPIMKNNNYNKPRARETTQNTNINRKK